MPSRWRGYRPWRGSRPRAAVLVLGAAPEDASRYDPAAVRQYLAAIHAHRAFIHGENVHAASRRMRQEIYKMYASFVAAFRKAAEHLKAGDRAARFPEGSFPPGLPFVRAGLVPVR